ncbi:MAG: hypothetical protein KDK45_09400 [Leptospiraceae bacterium]|nr:hypothetical protein [Leptospiraceae bacterium]
MIKQVLSTAGSFLPPGLPAGKTLSLDSFDTSGDPLTISNLQAGIFQYTFPADVRVDLRQDKVYSSTRIAGRKGTVKEVSGFDDWQATIRFMMVSPIYNASLINKAGEAVGFDNGLVDSMLDKLKELKKIWLKEAIMKVTNSRLNELDINYLFLKSLDLPDGESYWIQPVTIQAVSDDGL